jgi:hypothetical protein
MDKTYNSNTYLDDLDAIRQSEKISSEDMELLTSYIAISRLAGSELEGNTYSGILEKIKEVRKANLNENENANQLREAARTRLRPFVSVNVTGKKFLKVDGKDALEYAVSIKNTSEKNISMVIGSISLNDLLDREIKNVQVVLDEPLKANQTLNKKYSFDYDHASENDKQIRIKDLVDLRILWNPVKIIFEDGTAVE